MFVSQNWAVVSLWRLHVQNGEQAVQTTISMHAILAVKIGLGVSMGGFQKEQDILNPVLWTLHIVHILNRF